MKHREGSHKRILAMLLTAIMIFTSIPMTAFAEGTDVAVNDNVIDLADNKFASLSSYHATVTAVEITGAEVTSASQDGTNIYITLFGSTAIDANITANFQCSTNKFTVTQNINSVALEDGKADLQVKLSGKYNGSIERGTCTYTLYFTTDAVLTEVPECIKTADTKEVYAGNSVELNLKDYFSDATEYYILENGEKEKLDGAKYPFTSETAGAYTLTFAAANSVGECAQYVTVTVTVKEITSGIYINKVSSNGSLNHITFTDVNGNGIDDVKCSMEGNVISVTLPKSYDSAGKVTAKFNLTQNSEGVPFVTTKTNASGNTANRAWDQRTKEITVTLNGGSAKTTFYYYNVIPKVTSNKYETFTIEYAVENEIPELADKSKTGDTATITAGEDYSLNLSGLFTDADGDELTYYVSINGEDKVTADSDYSYGTNTAGEYKLVFTAYDGKGESVDSYTITLTVENVSETDSMIVNVSEGVTPEFYIANGSDTLGDPLTATKGNSTDGFDSYTVKYPKNVEYISFRTEAWGGTTFAAEKNGIVILTRVNVNTTDLSGAPLDATVAVTYGGNNVVRGTEGYLLEAGQTYSFTATPQDSDYVSKTQDITVEETADIFSVELAMGYKSPKTITVPTGATAQLFAYNKYYDFTEIPAKAEVDNGDGTTTFYFITTKTSLSYRASMDGKVTEAGFWMRNMTINFDDGKNSPQSNTSIEDNSVLVNVNGQNHLQLNVGDSYKLKGYRAWEIIKFSYQNEIITPDFNFEILSGSDVISLTPVESPSNGGSRGNSDWMNVTALKSGTAVIEVTYDAIDVAEGSWPGLYPATDADRTGLVVVTVGGADSSVDFGIDCFASQGGLTYNETGKKDWDAEFDTVYFTGESGKLDLNPTAGSSITEVAVSHDKGGSWIKLENNSGTYTADIKDGNNIIRVTTEAGVAYQVVRGGKVAVTAIEVAGASDGDGLIEAGESVRIILNGLYTPIPKISGNYNPGYKQNVEGDGGVHMVYNFLDGTVSSSGVQYTFGKEGNSIEVTIPEDYEQETVALTDGYIALGVVGLTAFADGGDSHRNIPDAGCTTRGSQTTFHTRSILPEIKLTIGEEASENNAPEVNADVLTEAVINLGQAYAINPETLFTDNDGDPLTYQVSINGGEAEAASAAYKFTPSAAGTYKLKFTADDGEATVSHTVTITVKDAAPPEEGGSGKLEFDIKDDEIDGYVIVSFEDNGVREPGATGLKYPVALGTIIDLVKVPYKDGDTVAAVTVRLLNALNIEYTHSGTVESAFYLSSIKNFEVDNTPYDEMGEFHAGSGSGWMITLNDVFINKGASDFQVKENDVIKWQYTCQLGADIGDNYTEEQIRNVEDQIDAIGTVTEDSGPAITEARQGYDSLNEVQKKAVKNYDVLVAAEKEYAELVADNNDREAAENVEILIADIGTVTPESEDKIVKARNAYDGLTDVQKLLVGNYETLVNAENYLNHLKNPSHEKIYKQTGDYITGLGTPYSGTVGGDWMALGLARSGRTVPGGYYDNVVSYVKENINKDGQLHWYKSTENARVILGLTATGYDPANVEGFNLLEALNDMEYVEKQGINGPIWTLIAFDSHDYEIPSGGDVTRDALVDKILGAQLEDGGWTLSGTIADTDMTAMALQALAPYYDTNPDVKTAVDKGVVYLSQAQNADGSFSGTDGINTESMAQVIVALTALGINPDTDSRFVKNELSVVDALCSLAVDGGGFRHTEDGALDGMATEQGYYALTAYMRFVHNETPLYDMSDVELFVGETTEKDTTEDLPETGRGDEETENSDAEIPLDGDEETENPDIEIPLDGDEETENPDTEIPLDGDEETENPDTEIPLDKVDEQSVTKSVTVKITGELTEAAKAVINQIDNLVPSDLPDDVEDYTDQQMQQIIDIYNAYLLLSDEEKLAVENSKNFTQFADILIKIGDFNHFDEASGVDMRENSNADLPWYIRVVVEPEELEADEKQRITSVTGKNCEILTINDIYFINTLDGSEWHPESVLNVKLSVEGIDEYKHAVIVHITDEGKIEFIEGNKSGNEISFKASSFSVYGVVGTDNDILDTDNSYAVWIIAGLMAVVALGFVYRRRKAIK